MITVLGTTALSQILQNWLIFFLFEKGNNSFFLFLSKKKNQIECSPFQTLQQKYIPAASI